MTTVVVLLFAGLVALVIGGELLVRGAVGLAEKAGVTPLAVGLVIVAEGSSSPGFPRRGPMTGSAAQRSIPIRERAGMGRNQLCHQAASPPGNRIRAWFNTLYRS